MELNLKRKSRQPVKHNEPQPLKYNSYTKVQEFSPLNDKQSEYLQLLDSSQITIALGEPGTGKTLCPIAYALDLLHNNDIDVIYITKPIVEVGSQSLGYLPGGPKDKLDPYMQSMLQHVQDLVGTSEMNRLLTGKQIQYAPLEYMRGMNLDNCVIIADEMQNATLIQFKTLLTRLKDNTRLVITGDPGQCDLVKLSSGLPIILKVLEGIKGISKITFTSEDIVRSGIVRDITCAFKKHGY